MTFSKENSRQIEGVCSSKKSSRQPLYLKSFDVSVIVSPVHTWICSPQKAYQAWQKDSHAERDEQTGDGEEEGAKAWGIVHSN